MPQLKFCRICLETNVRMHQISRSDVQDVYEKLTNQKIQQDRRLHFACYICYSRLTNSQQLVEKSQKSELLLKQMCGELDPEAVSFLDRMTYGLVDSFTGTKIQLLEIPMHNKFTQIQNRTDAGSNDMIDIAEPLHEGARLNNNTQPDEGHMFTQDKPNSIENSMEVSRTDLVANKSSNKVVGAEKQCFICNDCGKTCDTKVLLIKHIIGHEPVIDPSMEKQKFLKSGRMIEHSDSNTSVNHFKCQDCSFTCKTSSDLKRHNRNHTEINPFKCQYCRYVCNRSSDLKRHKKTHTGGKPFKCQNCSFKTDKSHSLKRHNRIHTGEKPFKCQHCSYVSCRKGCLKIHNRIHTGEKPYKCQYCNYASNVNGNLKNHIRTHTGENPFKCQYCNYACKLKRTLRDHTMTHTGEKPYMCQYCNYVSNRMGILKLHTRTHTGEKPYKCQYCSYSCTRNAGLKRHIRTHTG